MDKTVEEARGLVCPMSLSGANFQWKNCYAEKCMLWRWRKITPKAKDKTLRGYCGLGEK